MDVGFRKAGFEIIFANDLDPIACETFRENHGEIVQQGDLKKLLPQLKRFQNVGLVFGGPPCQGFSVAGKMNPDDARSQLIWTYLDVVDAVAPAAFVCENVKSLAVLSRWGAVRKKLIARASKKYAVALLLLNSFEFGVPQNRERMFLIGIRKDLLRLSEHDFSVVFKDLLSRQKSPAPTLRDVIKKLGRAGSRHNSRTCKAKIVFAKSPVMRKSPYAGMLFNGAGRPLSPNGRSSTLPASMGGNKTPIVDEAAIFDGKRGFVEKYHSYLIKGGKPRSGKAPRSLRRLTVDECLAIQTFPIGYTLYGSQSAMYRQIGNAVPCKLAEAVAVAVRQLIHTHTTFGKKPVQFAQAAE